MPDIGHKVWHLEPGDERSTGSSGKGLTAESFFRPRRGSAYVFGFRPNNLAVDLLLTYSPAHDSQRYVNILQ